MSKKKDRETRRKKSINQLSVLFPNLDEPIVHLLNSFSRVPGSSARSKAGNVQKKHWVHLGTRTNEVNEFGIFINKKRLWNVQNTAPCVPSALKLCPDHRIQLSRTWRWKVGSDYDIIPVTRCTYSLSFFHFAFRRSTPPAWWNFGDQSVCLSWRRWNLSVIHLVPHSVVELSRIRLSVWNWYLLQLTFGGRGLQILSMESSHSIPGFMELKSYLGVNSKTEVVVHHVQGRSERSDLW